MGSSDTLTPYELSLPALNIGSVYISEGMGWLPADWGMTPRNDVEIHNGDIMTVLEDNGPRDVVFLVRGFVVRGHRADVSWLTLLT